MSCKNLLTSIRRCLSFAFRREGRRESPAGWWFFEIWIAVRERAKVVHVMEHKSRR